MKLSPTRLYIITIALFVSTSVMLTVLAITTIIKQAKEIQDLRVSVSRYDRIRSNKSIVPDDPERAIILKASTELNSPYNLMLSMRQGESGAYLFEYGAIKINPRFKNLPARLQQYYEASYTVSYYMCKWLESDDEAMVKFIKYLSTRYPRPEDSGKWYRAVKINYFKYKNEEAVE